MLNPIDHIDSLRNEYIEICPEILDINGLLECLGQRCRYDHFAIRTLSLNSICLEKLISFYTSLSYKRVGEYQFEEKFLRGVHLEHADEMMPKIFLSEFQLESLGSSCREWIDSSSVSIDIDTLSTGKVELCSELSFETYEQIKQESSYVAWVYAHGLCVNHFALDLKPIPLFDGIDEFSDFLNQKGFEMNLKGGLIKGSAEEGLKQSSTMASLSPKQFSEGFIDIPGGYYEFVERFQLQGKTFQGFLEPSASKLFESTE